MANLNANDVVLVGVKIRPPPKHVAAHLVLADATWIVFQSPASQVQQDVPELRSLDKALARNDALSQCPSLVLGEHELVFGFLRQDAQTSVTAAFIPTIEH